MYNKQRMSAALRDFDWDAVVGLLPERSLAIVRELLGDVMKSGCLIRLYSLDQKQDESRVHMIQELTALSSQVGAVEATEYLEFLLEQVKITELALAFINNTVDLDDYAALPPEQKAWSTISWATREMLDVHRQIQAEFRKRAEGGPVAIDPLTVRLDKEHGHGIAAGQISQLSQTVANTLRMLSHRNGWTGSGRFTLPPRVYPTGENLSAAARISRLGDTWQSVLDESKHHRFWGGHFQIRHADEEQKAAMPSLEYVIESFKEKQEQSVEFQVAEYIAANRMQRQALAVQRHIARTNVKRASEESAG